MEWSLLGINRSLFCRNRVYSNLMKKISIELSFSTMLMIRTVWLRLSRPLNYARQIWLKLREENRDNLMPKRNKLKRRLKMIKIIKSILKLLKTPNKNLIPAGKQKNSSKKTANPQEKLILAKSRIQSFPILNIYLQTARIMKRVSRVIRQSRKWSVKCRVRRVIKLPAQLQIQNDNCTKIGVVFVLLMNLCKILYFRPSRPFLYHSTIDSNSTSNNNRNSNSNHNNNMLFCWISHLRRHLRNLRWSLFSNTSFPMFPSSSMNP